MRKPTRPPHGEGCQRSGSERLKHRPVPPGYWRRHAWKRGMDATRETLAVAWHAPTDIPRGTGRAVQGGGEARSTAEAGQRRWREGASVREQRNDGGRDMGTGESLTASERVQRLQTALHAKAKEAPGFRFYSLSDKVWRDDVLAVAWQTVRRNGGSAGVDGETVADVESFGADRWLGALARDLKAGTYRPRAVRQVLIPKKQRGKFRPLGIPCLRDRVAQTAAMLVLSPGRPATGAIRLPAGPRRA